MIVYHKNLSTIYPKEWIDQFKDSVLNQTRKDFVIFEMNYGGGSDRIFDHSSFVSEELPTFVHAMNMMIDNAFESGAIFVLNNNVDDFMTPNRVEIQVPYISAGYDLVSSNFCLVDGEMITKKHSFENVNIELELDRDHNVICHPVVAMSKVFWERNRYDPDQIPFEDMKLWQRAIKNSKFIILPEVLLFHRIHDQSVCKSQNR